MNSSIVIVDLEPKTNRKNSQVGMCISDLQVTQKSLLHKNQCKWTRNLINICDQINLRLFKYRLSTTKIIQINH